MENGAGDVRPSQPARGARNPRRLGRANINHKKAGREAMPMRTVVASILVLAAALSGCTSDPEPMTFTCPGGATVTVPANMTAQPQDACPKAPPPKPPSIAFQPPQELRIYRPFSFAWSLDAGNHTGGHSMDSQVRLSTVSVADGALAGPESYGMEIAKKEHQNLPVSLSQEYTFKVPGMYYVRVYATILADGLESRDYWTPEHMLMVADVAPSGNNTTVTHAVGNVAGKVAPDTLDLRLGDGIILKNDDLVDHVFTPQSCEEHKDPVTVAKTSSSPVILFKAPGTCVFKTDDLQPQSLTVNVSP